VIYALKRLAALVMTLVVASVVVFLVVEVVPGDPAAYMLGLNAAPDTVAALRTELGLDRTGVARWFEWVSGMLVGDFGVSYTYRTEISTMVLDRIFVSLPLAIYALLLAVLIAFPAGVLAASHRRGIGDTAVCSPQAVFRVGQVGSLMLSRR